MTKHKTVTEFPVKREPEGRRSVGYPFGELDRLFDRMMSAPFGAGWMRPWLGEPMGFAWEGRFPKLDVLERDDEVVVRAELPGVERKDIDVALTDHELTIRGTSRHEEEKEEGEYHYRETRSGEFSRTVPLPALIDEAKVRAVFRDGMLELTLPKREEARPRPIEIQE